jgi:hypothetical protein
MRILTLSLVLTGVAAPVLAHGVLHHHPHEAGFGWLLVVAVLACVPAMLRKVKGTRR